MTASTARPLPDDLAAATPVVVVGIDGSTAASEALLFAAHEAQLRQAVLRIVAAHDLGAAAYSWGGFGGGWEIGPIEDGMRQAAELMVKAAADTVANDVAGIAVHVQTLVGQGRPSDVLLNAAEGAALLVVGARGEGALTRLMMGSTSTEVVHSARLPVTVVPSAPVSAP